MNVQTNAYQILTKVILAHKEHCNILLAQMMQTNNFTILEKTLIEKLVIGTLKNQIYFLEITDQLLFTSHTLTTIAIINKDMVHISSLLLAFCFAKFRSEFNLLHAKYSTMALIKHSYPQWLYNLIKQQFSTNITVLLMKDNPKQPVISFRVNTLKTTIQNVLTDPAYQTFGFQLSKIIADGIISYKSIFDTELYHTGKIIKQDQISMLVSHMLIPKPYDEVVRYVCCVLGIGSKTAHIATLMNNTGAIIASDINPERLQMADQYLMKLGVTNTKTIVCDAITWNTNQKFDKILIDAPSTASGLIKRKPEVKLINWSNEQIKYLITTQFQLLEKAYQQLKPQGILVYVTCTFNIQENQNQIEAFMKKFPKMTIIEEQQIFGVHEQTDGLYICKLKK